MINKQNLWFVTLFSLILILGLYYLSIGDEAAKVLKTESDNLSKEVIEISESDELVALEVEKEEERETLLEEYQDVLLNSETSLEEKNKAYDDMQKLNDNSSEENKIKMTIKNKHGLDSFVKIKDNTISIVIASNKHDNSLANQIIRSVQELYTVNKYITVKFN